MRLKPVYWCGSSYEDLLALPRPVQHDAGYQLHRVQEGKDPRDFAPVPSVGRGVYEIRVAEDRDTYRVFYVAKFEEAVYVLHAFKKKSTKGIATPKRHLTLAAKRYRDVVRDRPALKR